MPGRLPFRSAVVVTAIGGLTWSVLNVSGHELAGGMLPMARDIVVGQSFAPRDVRATLASIDVPAANAACDEPVLMSALVLSADLIGANGRSVSNPPDDADRLADVERTSETLVRCSPYQSFAWFSLFVARVRSWGLDSKTVEYLTASYRLGAREPWIAVWRNPLALRAFKHLPDALQQDVVGEFGDLVQAGLVDSTAASFVGGSPLVQERLTQQIEGFPRVKLKNFNRALAALDADIPAALVDKVEPQYWR